MQIIHFFSIIFLPCFGERQSHADCPRTHCDCPVEPVVAAPWVPHFGVAQPAQAPKAAPAVEGGCWCEGEEDCATSAAATRRRRCRPPAAAPAGGAACCRARAVAPPCLNGACATGCRRPRAPTAPKRRRRSNRPACCRLF